jgi:hypothetical protein
MTLCLGLVASQGFDPASAPLGVDAKHGAKSLGRWPQNSLPTGLSFADLSRRFVPDGSDNRAVQI